MRIVSVIYLCLALTFSVPAYAVEPTFEDAFSPRQGATELVVKTIQSAKQTIHVAAYSFTSAPIAAALITAHNKGIDVKVVVDKSQKQSKMVMALAAQGIPTRINYNYKIMHNKFMVIDNHTLQLGSFNYTASAEGKNAENVLVIRNQQKITADYERQWKKIWGEAE